MARRITIETPEHVDFSVELADLGSRFLAILLDTAVQVILIAAVLALGALIFGGLTLAELSSDAMTTTLSVLGGAGLFVGFLIFWGYHIGFETWGRGQTPGKRVVGLRVVKDSGAPEGFLDAVIRNLMRVIDLLPASYAVGVISILSTKTHKRLGDMAAGTLVVREPKVGAFAGVAGLDPARQRLLVQFLERVDELEPEARDRIALAMAERFDVADGTGDPARALSALARLRAPAREVG